MQSTGITQRRKPVLVIVLMLALVAVALFRVVHDRKLAQDAVQYADMHEAIGILHARLLKAPASQTFVLIKQCSTSQSASMRYAALDALDTEITPERNRDIEEMLDHAYLDDASEVRKKAMELMIRVDREQGYRMQLQALRDEDVWLRDDAALQLCVNAIKPHSYVDKRAVPVLMQALDDPDKDVPPLAMATLKYITGNSWRYSVSASPEQKSKIIGLWHQWWRTASRSWPTREFDGLAPVLPTLTEAAPAFRTRDIDGKEISNKSIQGRITLINFWGTWCPPCKAEMPALARIYAEYRTRGVTVIGVAGKEDSVESLRKWCNLRGVSYPQVTDADADEMELVFGNIHEVPVSFIIDKHGRMRRRYDGERDYTTFKLAIDHLLQE